MGEASLSVELTESAYADLSSIDDYWTDRGEAWRGEKYYCDLRDFALRELSDPSAARRGRRARVREHPEARAILAFGVYRVIYRIDEAAARVEVLRFWHAHRDTPPPS